jgi:pyruvate dehydrogenase E2 component (dihydrolipoamide acetyltransferase)
LLAILTGEIPIMVFEFKLPDIGEGVHEGEISKWLVKSGDQVKEDQPMVEVMTDKVTVEITSPVSGTIQELHYQPGQVVKVGSIIITIDESGAPAQPKEKVAAAVAPTTNGGAKVAKVSEEAPAVTVGSRSNTAAPPRIGGGRVLAAPAVRKLARSMGVDMELISGSGPHGRVRRDDVIAYSPGKSAPTSYPTQPRVPGERREERKAFIGMRRKIGDHLVKSKHTAPHFTYVEEADMTKLVNLRDDLLPSAEAEGAKLSFLPFIIKAVIEGLKKYPILNSSLDEATQEIIIKHYYNIGVAVATNDGLIVPVIHDADQKSLLELAREISDLSDRARKGKLSLSDLQGGTFTLTSIGSIGGIFSAPIINYPEVAIMGIQKIEKRPVVRDDQVVIREMTYFSISCDHRVVDGVEAALFMKEAIDWMEHPGRLLLNAH